MGVMRLFDRGAFLYPDRLCLVDGQVRRTYSEVAVRLSAIAGALADLAPQVGTHCAVYSPNSALAVECMLGIYRAGHVFVPLNAKNHVSENVVVATQCEVSVLFYAASLRNEVQTLLKACPQITQVVCMDAPHEGTLALEALVARRLAPPPAPSHDNERIVSIYSTGGTTGAPKGVMFTPLTWETMAANFYAGLPCTEPPVYLAITPITHAAGTIAKLLFAQGATIVIHAGFDAQCVMDDIQAYRVTHLYLPPTAIYMLLAHPRVRDCDYGSLRCFMYASSPMSVHKLRECLEIFGPVMVQFWGQTEAPIFCTCLDQAAHVAAARQDHARLASCGQPMLLTSVAVMDEDGQLLPPGERGELVVHGNLVMAGYYHNAQATARAMHNGWLRTGDVGYRDEQGYFYIVDRLKDMIITGGFNVFPSEIEQVLWSHTAVKECAVVGVPDDKWGEAVKAVVELKPGAQSSEQELLDWCKSRLGSVKTPKSVEFWSELPRTPVGKVSKKDIRQRYWEGQSRTI